VKEVLVQEAGGCCVLCGYDRYNGALEFHHVNPAEKSFQLGLSGLTRSIEAMRAEASKCLLLCSNCHAEVEGGVTALV
jgi:5-methylcytosine-specific restriction endonuclease McrA